jgi:hypothetical protein
LFARHLDDVIVAAFVLAVRFSFVEEIPICKGAGGGHVLFGNELSAVAELLSMLQIPCLLAVSVGLDLFLNRIDANGMTEHLRTPSPAARDAESRLGLSLQDSVRSVGV